MVVGMNTTQWAVDRLRDHQRNCSRVSWLWNALEQQIKELEQEIRDSKLDAMIEVVGRQNWDK